MATYRVAVGRDGDDWTYPLPVAAIEAIVYESATSALVRTTVNVADGEAVTEAEFEAALDATHPHPPDTGAFWGAVIGIFGHKRSTALDRDYASVWRGLEAGGERGYALAYSAIAAMYAEADITQAEHDAVIAAWRDANLPESEAVE